MVLVGVQPSFTQVPPNLARSIIATFIPAAIQARRERGAGLAGADYECIKAAGHRIT